MVSNRFFKAAFKAISIGSVTAAILSCSFYQGMDVDHVALLHESLVKQGPQARADRELALLRTPEDDIKSLKVHTDPKTGRKTIKLKLGDAVLRALAYNTEIGVAAYQPAIARQVIISEEAEFDPVLSAYIGYETNDNPVNLAVRIPGRKTKDAGVGISQRLGTGAEWSVTNTISKIWNSSQADSRTYSNDLDIQIIQPLLRDAGTGVNLAGVRIASLDYETSLSRFHQEVERIITEVSTAYYRLIQARGTVEIYRELLGYAEATYRRVKQREEIDATIVTIKQAEAAVEQRIAVLTDARKELEDVRDELARLIPGSNLSLAEDYELIPLETLNDVKVKIDLTDRILTALNQNPDMEQVRLALESSDITLEVAENGVLPVLNLSAGTTIHGGSADKHQTWEDLTQGRYASYFVQLDFEYPLGNRAAESQLAQSRYRKLQEVTRLQDTADKVTQVVREAARRANSSYETYLSQKKTVAAYLRQLKGLEDLENKRESLTPEFLNLKLSTQESLAIARLAELQAKTTYNTALVDLDRACGTLLKRHHVELALPVMEEGGP